jgi:hypothetical protein
VGAQDRTTNHTDKQERQGWYDDPKVFNRKVERGSARAHQSRQKRQVDPDKGRKNCAE